MSFSWPTSNTSSGIHTLFPEEPIESAVTRSMKNLKKTAQSLSTGQPLSLSSLFASSMCLSCAVRLGNGGIMCCSMTLCTGNPECKSWIGPSSKICSTCAVGKNVCLCCLNTLDKPIRDYLNPGIEVLNDNIKDFNMRITEYTNQQVKPCFSFGSQTSTDTPSHWIQYYKDKKRYESLRLVIFKKIFDCDWPSEMTKLASEHWKLILNCTEDELVDML